MARECAARSLDGIDLAALRVRAAGRGGAASRTLGVLEKIALGGRLWS